ncbi:MAG: SUMF1/EgtB/PvdO family nonheme iron enzyme [Candidatus Omnitrophica bacterium]|nr:SUMF1/EgtB/PvdO family nonheme iron enzyme [Candidatus Omnitrophota bacterium]
MKREVKAAEQRVGAQAYALAKDAYDKGNNEEGLKYLRQAADAGHAESQYILGMKYYNGGQIPKDDRLSFEWTEKAAKQGHVAAAFQMYSKYIRGTGVEKNEKKAHKYLRQSMEGGNTDVSAKFLLAQNYWYGWGTKKNPLLAVNWLRQAAAEGHANAIKMLESVSQDEIVKQSVFKSCDVCPTMVTLPEGAFLMGVHDPNSVDLNTNKNLTNQPRHFVNLPHTFALGQTEVTHAQWNACVGDKGCARPVDTTQEKANHPVTYVSWKEAQEYIAWISKKTNRPYRLPTESEWEYAARSGVSTAYPYGISLPPARANCKGCGSQWDNQSTAPVKSFAPNGYGLYEMLGNAAEWTDDCVNKSYKGKPPMGISWATGYCEERIHRGGAWDTSPKSLRVYNREYQKVGDRRLNLGFRLALTLKEFPKRAEAAKAATAAGANQESKSITQKKPSCSGRKEIDGWKFFWTHDYFYLKPALYDINDYGIGYNKKYVELTISRGSTGNYFMMFKFGGTYHLGDIYQLYVDGIKVYVGQWTSETSADGKSQRDNLPSLTADVIQKMESGKVAEVRAVKRNYDDTEVILISAKFSLTDFAKHHKDIDQHRQITEMKKQIGGCR